MWWQILSLYRSWTMSVISFVSKAQSVIIVQKLLSDYLEKLKHCAWVLRRGNSKAPGADTLKPYVNKTCPKSSGKMRLRQIPFSSVQSLSGVWLFATPWTAARQAFLSITNSLSLLKFMSIELVMPSNRLILCHPLLLPPSIFPSIRVFSNESVLCNRWPKYWSFSFSILLMNIQDWFPWGLTGLISLQSKGLSRVFSNTTVQKHQFFGTQLSL